MGLRIDNYALIDALDEGFALDRIVLNKGSENRVYLKKGDDKRIIRVSKHFAKFLLDSTNWV